MQIFQDEPEVEFSRLCEGLHRDRILRFAKDRDAVFGGGVEGSTHLVAVGELAARYVHLLYPDGDLLEKRYMSSICEAAGFLHESMLRGASFEDLVDLADEAVARLVAAITPDLREPAPKRMKLLSNQVGRAGPHAQLILMADLRHGCVRHRKLVDVDASRAARWLEDAHTLLGSLSFKDTPLGSRFAALRGDLYALGAQLEEQPASNGKHNGKHGGKYNGHE